MEVIVHLTIGDKETNLIGFAPLFYGDLVEANPLEKELKGVGFFLYFWRMASVRGQKHDGWCFIPWASCWVEEIEAVPVGGD